MQEILSRLRVSLGTSKTKFPAALSPKNEIAVEGVVKGGKDAFITKVGRFDVDLSVEGIVVLIRQSDRPGIIAGAINHQNQPSPVKIETAHLFLWMCRSFEQSANDPWTSCQLTANSNLKSAILESDEALMLMSLPSNC